MKKNITYIATALLLVGSLVIGLSLYTKSTSDTETTTAPITTQQTDSKILDEEPVVANSSPQTTESLLLYLIEEEKLAHDVYTVMNGIYGTRVFGNILNSESTHQSRVLTLLTQRNISDPRSTDIGVFANQDLQKLYNTLIEQGKISEQEAFKVGVIIEEKDIKDISDQLATASETDVISTLEDLRRGSENHLRAFSRQL